MQLFIGQLIAQENTTPPNKEKLNVFDEAKAMTVAKVGEKAPEFKVEMLDGRMVNLSDLKGKVVLLNFWATWCSPCMTELAEIPEKILTPFKDKNFVFLPISRGEKPEVVKKRMDMLKEKGIDFPVGIDPDSKVFLLYSKSTIPRNFLIDQEGNVIESTIGYSDNQLDELAQKIKAQLNKNNGGDN